MSRGKNDMIATPGWSSGSNRGAARRGQQGIVMTTQTRVEMESIDEAVRNVARRVQAEYDEMPGLCITLRQAQRLLSIDDQTCATVFNTLMHHGVLKRTKDGQYVRA
jgi:hypothetical protein